MFSIIVQNISIGIVGKNTGPGGQSFLKALFRTIINIHGMENNVSYSSKYRIILQKMVNKNHRTLGIHQKQVVIKLLLIISLS